MTDLTEVLASANSALAADARDSIIEVEEQVVLQGDRAEYADAQDRVITTVRTNHQITVADRLGMYQDAAWHGLGEVISAELSGREACDRFLGWSVIQEPCYTEVGPGRERRLLPIKANLRSDTNDLLGIVGPDYKLVQNHDLGDFADALLAEAKAEGVKVRMETCGSLLGGRKVFLTMRPEKEIRVGKTGNDVSVPLLTLLNGHDGSLAMSVCWTFVRVCCNNTFTSALGNINAEVGTGRGFRIRHQGNVQDYLQQAKACLGLAVKGLEQFQVAADRMANTGMPLDSIVDFFREAYAAQFGPVAKNPKTEQEEAAKLKADRIVGEWTRMLGDDENKIDGIGGSLWSAFNCITQWQDHVRTQNIKGSVTSETQSRKDHLKLLGAGATDKRKVFKIAMSLSV